MSLSLDEIVKRGVILEPNKECRKCEGKGILAIQKTETIKGMTYTKLAEYKVLCTCVKALDLNPSLIIKGN